MSPEVIKNQVKTEDVAFWFSIGSMVFMSVLFIAEAGKVIIEFPFLTITTAGLFGLIAAFFFGLQASLKGRPAYSLVQHFLFSLFMMLFCLFTYMFGYWAFDFITSALG